MSFSAEAQIFCKESGLLGRGSKVLEFTETAPFELFLDMGWRHYDFFVEKNLCIDLLPVPSRKRLEVDEFSKLGCFHFVPHLNFLSHSGKNFF